jgi:hypothetical protein
MEIELDGNRTLTLHCTACQVQLQRARLCHTSTCRRPRTPDASSVEHLLINRALCGGAVRLSVGFARLRMTQSVSNTNGLKTSFHNIVGVINALPARHSDRRSLRHFPGCVGDDCSVE